MNEELPDAARGSKRRGVPGDSRGGNENRSLTRREKSRSSSKRQKYPRQNRLEQESKVVDEMVVAEDEEKEKSEAREKEVRVTSRVAPMWKAVSGRKRQRFNTATVVRAWRLWLKERWRRWREIKREDILEDSGKRSQCYAGFIIPGVVEIPLESFHATMRQAGA